MSPSSRLVKDGIHALDLAAHGEVIAGLELVLQARQNVRDRLRHRAEIAVLDGRVDVIDALNVGVVEDGLHLSAMHGRDIAEHVRHRASRRDAWLTSGTLLRSFRLAILYSGVCTAR